MKLALLIDGLPVQLTQGDPSIDILSITDDSRSAAPGSLFVARSGTKTSGGRFVKDAVAAGAAAVLSAAPCEVPAHVALLLGEVPQHVAIKLADRLHGDPSRHLTLLGVTGTNGKSTTAWLMQQMLIAAGHRCGMISTTIVDDGASKRPARITTPGALEIRAILGAMCKAACTHAVIEISSHAIDQGRIEGLDFAAAVFTNLSGDHLDYHQTMDAYAEVKARLFERLAPAATAIVNADDPVSARIVRDCGARVLRSSVRDHTADCAASLHAQSIHSTQFTLRGPWGEIESQTSLIGAHNVSNVLQACAACHAVGVSGQSIADAIASAEAPPGRLEAVTTPAHPFTVLVDYSHTDGALDTVLRELRPLVPRGGKMRTLFGCGGDRDRTKRPRMAQAALRHSDEITITSDNPRHESPTAIIDQILVGVPADMRDRVIVEADRRAAIGLAIMNCRPGDVLLIAGKGHETSQIIGNESRPFDDRVVAREALGNVELGMPIT